jgi:hypothetical protein
MAKKNSGKSEQAFALLKGVFGENGFSYEEACDALGEVLTFNKQTLSAMRKKDLIEEKDNLIYLTNLEEVTITEATGPSEWVSMHRRHFVCEMDPSKFGTGDFFTKEDLKAINRRYMSWKLGNEDDLMFGCRRTNLPEILTEGLASALLGMPRTNNMQLHNIDESADLVDVVTGEVIQIKGVSTIGEDNGGPTSFGPRTTFDRLIVIHVRVDQNKAYFYELSAEEHKAWPVNKNETIADQQEAGRRPRVTILPIIKKQKLTPFMVYSYETGEIEC